MVYSEYDDGSDSAEDRRTHHVRINERVKTIVPTDGFVALNNLPGSNRLSRPNLNVPLGIEWSNILNILILRPKPRNSGFVAVSL